MNCHSPGKVTTSKSCHIITMHIGYKAGVGTKKNWPYNQYGLISDVTMEGPGEGMEGLI